MKTQTTLCLLTLVLTFAGLTSATLAGPMMTGSKTVVEEVQPPESTLPLMEMKFSTDYTFESDFENGDFTGEEGPAVWVSKYSYLRRIPLAADDWYVRVGLDYSYWDIGESAAPLPDTLQSVAVPLGIEWNKGRFYKFLFQVNPGLYFSTDISSNDFDIPTLAIYGFDLTDDFTLYVGAVGGLFSKYGVLPVGGFVWSPQRWLVIRGTFPEAGVYFSPTEQWTFFAGGEFSTGSFRVDRDEDLPPALRDALLDYTEIRVGGHVTWRPSDNVELTLGGGYAVHRDWEYERAGVDFEQEGAPYAKAALKLKF